MLDAAVVIDPLVGQVARGVVPPVVVAAVLLGVEWVRLRRVKSGLPGRGWALPVAMGAGWFAALAALEQVPPLPPITGIQGLGWAVLAIGGVASIDARWPRSGLLWWVGVVPAATLATAWLLLRRLWQGWTATEAMTQTGLAAVGMMGLAVLVEIGARRGPGWVAAAVLSVAATGGALVLAAGSALQGQLAGALAASAGCVAAWSWLDGRDRIGRGASLTFGCALGGLLLAGRHFSEVEPIPLLAIGFVPVCAMLGAVPRRWPRWCRALAALAIAALIAGLAVAFGAPEDPYGY
ncbi:MAG: hypothetical protein AAF628_11865 [Planctomycetota bacterium]